MNNFLSIISIELQEATSVDEVVDLINDGGTCFFTGDEIAGQYAYKCAASGQYGRGEAEIEAHLDITYEEGARFDYIKAFEEAKRCIEEELEWAKKFFGESSEQYIEYIEESFLSHYYEFDGESEYKDWLKEILLYDINERQWNSEEYKDWLKEILKDFFNS